MLSASPADVKHHISSLRRFTSSLSTVLSLGSFGERPDSYLLQWLFFPVANVEAQCGKRQSLGHFLALNHIGLYIWILWKDSD